MRFTAGENLYFAMFPNVDDLFLGNQVVREMISKWAENKFGDFALYGTNLLWFSITRHRREFESLRREVVG